MIALSIAVQSECVQRVIQVVVRSQKLAPEQVTIDSEFEALGIDSMDAVEILFELESEFSIVIPDDQLHKVRTVRQAAESVERLLGANSPGAAASYHASCCRHRNRCRLRSGA